MADEHGDRHAMLDSIKENIRRENKDILASVKKEIFNSDGSPTPSTVVKEYYDGSRYEGFMNGGKRSGKGVYYYRSGDIYAGDWKDDKFHGDGRRS